MRQCRTHPSKGTPFSATRALIPRYFLPPVPLVIHKKLNNKTEKTRGLPCLAPTSVLRIIPYLLRIIHRKIRRFQDFLYVAPPFEQCCTSSTSSDAVSAASSAFPANGSMFSRTLQTFRYRFLCVICPELLQ